jgi:hypothetical protein
MTIKLNDVLIEIATTATAFTEKGKCWVCEEDAKPKIHTEAGEREFRISGTCEECFDRMFEEE